MLKVAGVVAHYGRAQILFDVSFEVTGGRAVALLGRNGAGKSTLLKCIAGLVPVTAGRIELGGRDITRSPAYRISRLGVGYVPEDRRIFATLSVEENLMVGMKGRSNVSGGWTVERIFDLFPNLGTLRRHRGNEISGGEQQMLAIARTLMTNPVLLLLDEPAEGLAPRILESLAQTIETLKAEGLTILLSEQNMRFAAEITDDACVIESGQIRWRGRMETLGRDTVLARTYLTV